jgi:tetratricopeptide (TPR) repeat protein
LITTKMRAKDYKITRLQDYKITHLLTPSTSCRLHLSPLTSSQQIMSAFSAPPINPNLEQLKSEAITLEGSKKHDESLAKFEEVLVIQQRDLPSGHADTHETLISIDRVIEQLKYVSVDNLDAFHSAQALYLKGRYADSYLLPEQTYNRLVVTCGENNESTMMMYHYMAKCLYDQGRYVDALSMLEKLSERQTMVLSDEHKDTLQTMGLLADSLIELKRLDEALAVLEEVVPKLARARGEDHKDTLVAMGHMAHAQYSLFRFDETRRTAERGLLLARRVVNDE